MASKYRSDEAKEVPAMSTGSMPDIIFMLIFFFMVTTSMREVSLKVKMILPEATEVFAEVHGAGISNQEC